MQEKEILEELQKELGKIREKKGSLDKEIENLQAKIEERDRLREGLQEKEKIGNFTTSWIKLWRPGVFVVIFWAFSFVNWKKKLLRS